MSITDELREWGESRAMVSTKEAIRAIADRIDAEHQEKVRAARADGYKTGWGGAKYEACEGSIPATDENMAEHGWIRLPVDADGEPIRVGDVMVGWGTLEYHDIGEQPVESMVLRDGWTVYCDYNERRPQDLRHHHEPTVEDVLTELEGMRGNGATYEDVVTRCAELAEMLRELLAGDDE